MSQYRRPWWLLVNKPAGLVTTIHEDATPEERVFVVRGEPLVQGLAWLIWGPVAALVVVALLTGLAISLNIQEQSGGTRFLFVAAFLALPALAWGAATLAMSRLSAKHLQAEQEAEVKVCTIRLNNARRQFIYQTPGAPAEISVDYDQIRGIRATPAIGVRDGTLMQLTLYTDAGKFILMDEAFGTSAQKVDLANEIETFLPDKKKSSS